MIFMMGFLIFCLGRFIGELQNCKAMYLCSWSSDTNAFHTLCWKVILIAALNSKINLLKKEDCQNTGRHTKRNQNYPFLIIFEKMVNISLPDLLIYTAWKVQLACIMCAFPVTSKAQWTEKEETDMFVISFIKENKRKLEISKIYIVLANSW